MYDVGTDTMTVVDGAAAPVGVRHAITRDGRLMCRPTRPRFAWPALTWDGDDAACCPTCIDIATAPPVPTAPAVPAYPHESAWVPAQPEPELESAEW